MVLNLIQSKKIRFSWFNLIVDISFYLAIFGGSLTWKDILPFKLYLYYPVIPPLIIIFLFKYKVINVYILALSVLLLGMGIVQVVMGNNSFGLLTKIWIGILIHYLYYYYLLKHYNFNYVLIFKKYIQACCFLSWIAMIQLVSWLLNFQPGYNFTWLLPNVHNALRPGDKFRAQSLLTEPSTLGTHLIPVVFLGLCLFIFPKMKGNFITKKQSIICFIGFLLAVSSTGFFGLGIGFVIIAISRGNVKQLTSGLIIGVLTFLLLFTFSDAFQMRLINFVGLIFTSELNYKEIGSTDTSNFVLFNNGWVAVKNIYNHPLTGTGLGSHPFAYDNYSLTRDLGLANSYYATSMELNKEDAGSLFFRIMSETGLFGLVLLFYFLIRYAFISLKNDDEYQNWLVSNASLVIIFTCLLRAGHYFLLGIPLFFIIFYYTGKQAKTTNIKAVKIN